VLEAPASFHWAATISTNVLQVIEASKATQVHAMDVHLKKNKNPLLATAGLNHARAGTAEAPSLDKIQIHIEVHVKGTSKHDHLL